MTTLSELQRLMREALLAPSPDSAVMQALESHVAPTTGLNAAEHVAIYRRAVYGTLLRAMQNIYPVCCAIVGEIFFDAMAGRFVRAHRSGSADLAEYGAGFAEFIGDFEPAAALPYLADVARLEWHWHRAFNAPDEVFENLSGLKARSETQLRSVRLRLPASAALLRSPYPVQRIWQVNQPEWTGDASVNLDTGPARLLVWRHELNVRIDEPGDAAWWLLSAIAQGQSLGEIADANQSFDLVQILPEVAAQGLIAGFDKGAT